jgi:hypothetical protein
VVGVRTGDVDRLRKVDRVRKPLLIPPHRGSRPRHLARFLAEARRTPTGSTSNPRLIMKVGREAVDIFEHRLDAGAGIDLAPVQIGIGAPAGAVAAGSSFPASLVRM